MSTKKKRFETRHRRRLNPFRRSFDMYTILDALDTERGKITTPAQLRTQLRKICDDEKLWELMGAASEQRGRAHKLADALARRFKALV